MCIFLDISLKEKMLRRQNRTKISKLTIFYLPNVVISSTLKEKHFNSFMFCRDPVCVCLYDVKSEFEWKVPLGVDCFCWAKVTDRLAGVREGGKNTTQFSISA